MSMDNSKPQFLSSLLLILLFFFVLISPAISDNILETMETTGSPTGLDTAPNSSSLSCAQSLMSCQAYLHQPETNPPDLCCGPLRTMLASDHKCLCDFFTDGPVLRNMNVPKENAVKLANACGSNPDTSSCNSTSSEAATTNPSSASPYSNYKSGATMIGALSIGGSAIITVFTTFVIFSSIQWF